MTVTELFSPALTGRGRAPADSRRGPRSVARRRALPGVERLEGLLLLSGLTASQTVSVSSSGNAYPVVQALPTINQFNPALGTLDSVIIQVNGSLSSQVQVTNGNPQQSTTAIVNLSGSVTLNGPLIGAALTDTLPPVTVTSPTLAPNQVFLFPQPVATSAAASETLTDPGLLNAYTGTGTVDLATAVTLASSSVLPGDPNFPLVSGGFLTSSQAAVTVTYNYTPPPPGAVSGFVYRDVNNNGLKNPGEPGFAGETVVLTGTTTLGETITPETTVTDANGFYNFGTVPAGTYTVTETTEPAGVLRGRDSLNGVILPIGTVDAIPGIVVTPGNTSPNNDFGKIPPGVVSGFVYGDTNANGLKNPGEPGFGAVKLTLTGTDDLGNHVSMTTVTNSSGFYSFGSLRPATYTVTENTVPAGLRPFKNSRNGVVLPLNLANDAVPGIAVPVGTTAPNNNFGLIAKPGGPTTGGPSALSGYVFDDTTNPNGIKNPGEPGLANVSVTLTGTNELGDHVTMTTKTNSSGFYQFPGLFAGAYTLNEGASPTNFHHGLTSRNNVVVPNSFATHLIPNVTLVDQQVLPNNDFAELRNSSPQMPCGPLNITNIQRFGVHNEPTEIVLSFNEALDSATALNPANYVLRDTVNFVPVGAPVSYRAIVYNAAAHTVTLITSAPVNVHHQYLLSVAGVKCVDDTYTLSGTTGIQGTPYKVTVNRSQLSGFLTNQGVFIPVNHGQFAPGTFGLVPPVGGASAGALAGYPIALSSLPAQVNGKPSQVIIGSTGTTTTAAKTVKATTVKTATVKAATPAAKVVTVGQSTPKPFSIG